MLASGQFSHPGNNSVGSVQSVAALHFKTLQGEVAFSSLHTTPGGAVRPRTSAQAS